MVIIHLVLVLGLLGLIPYNDREDVGLLLRCGFFGDWGILLIFGALSEMIIQ